MLIETEGTHSGLYVAKCAKSECGYLGKSCPPLLLEGNTHQFRVYQFYWNKYIPNSAFQARGTLVAVSLECRSYICLSVSLTDSELEAPNEERPRHVLHVSEVERENQLQESGTYSILIII